MYHEHCSWREFSNKCDHCQKLNKTSGKPKLLLLKTRFVVHM
jgi:hypothetical protein